MGWGQDREIGLKGSGAICSLPLRIHLHVLRLVHAGDLLTHSPESYGAGSEDAAAAHRAVSAAAAAAASQSSTYRGSASARAGKPCSVNLPRCEPVAATC